MKMLLGLMLMMVMVGCNQKIDKAELEKMLNDNPEILFKVMENHADKFIKTAQSAARKANPNRQAPEENPEEEFKNPKKPEVNPTRILGQEDAPILIVEYTDLECPFCSRGNNTLVEVKKMYGDKVKILTKHLPLPMHPNARPAAQYFEAIAQSHSLAKAHEWKSMVFANQAKFRAGDAAKFLDEMAKKVKVDAKKVRAVLNNESKMAVIEAQIEMDLKEARDFQIMGTPGFLINGVSLKGAYPAPMFKEIIDRHLNGK